MHNELTHQRSDYSMIVLAGLIVITLIAAAVLIIGYGTSWGGRLKIAQAATTIGSTTGTTNATLNLTIVTGEMMGQGSQGPAYVPSNFTVPAYSTVTVTVTDFDTATPLTGALTKFAKVTGTVGDVAQVQSINAQSPNTTIGPLKTISRLNPALVAHTLTIPRLGINVPMAGQARTTFTIKTGKPGKYLWQCMDPCGSGSNGFGAPMGENGFMAGFMTVAS